MTTTLAAPSAASSHRPSIIGRLDPRAKLVLVLGALLVMLTEPPATVAPFAPYFVLTLALLATARVAPAFVARRLAAVAPIVLLAATVLVLAGGHADATDRAMSMSLRAFAAVALVCVLVGTERMSGILWGMSALGMPRLFCTLSAFMYRYALLLGDEAMRTERARRSRSPDAPRFRSPATWASTRRRRLNTLGGQAALVFLRGWKRSRSVYDAMLSRGFTGHFPMAPPGRVRSGDIAIVAICLAAFIGVRIFWP